VLDKEGMETFSRTAQSGKNRGIIYVEAVWDMDDTAAQERAKELKVAWSQKTSKKWTKRAELTVEQYDRLIASKSAEGKLLNKLWSAGKIIMENPFGYNHKINEEIPLGAYKAMQEMAGRAPPTAAKQPEGEMTPTGWLSKRAEITKEEGEVLKGSNGPGGKLWKKLLKEKKIVKEDIFGYNHKINARILVKDYDMMKDEADALMHPKEGEPVLSPDYKPLDEPVSDFPDVKMNKEDRKRARKETKKNMNAAKEYIKRHPEDEEAKKYFAKAEGFLSPKKKNYGLANDAAKTILLNAGKNGKPKTDAPDYEVPTEEEALLGLGGQSGTAAGPTKTAKRAMTLEELDKETPVSPPNYRGALPPIPPPDPEYLEEMTPDRPVAPPAVPPADELEELVEDLKDYEEKPDNDGFEDVEELEDDENEII